ncbi:MAG TPA: hypothetical protein VF011_20385 [Terriglobales bacterium]
MSDIKKKPTPGQTVTLRALPKGFVDDLPEEDQRAMTAVVGRRIRLNRYEEDGRAELEFTDGNGIIHFVYVDPKYIE